MDMIEYSLSVNLRRVMPCDVYVGKRFEWWRPMWFWSERYHDCLAL